MKLKQEPILETELVLINIDHKPAFYARVETITADVKPKWWRVTFLFLTFPVQIATWIIDDEQIRGADFTMGGTPIRIEKVKIPEDAVTEEHFQPKDSEKPGKKSPARVLSLSNAKKGQKK
jgi:hypothetical protein